MEAQTHRRLAEQYERVVADIRKRPGFKEFLLPKTLSDFLLLPHDGLIVIINLHEARSDALALVPGCGDLVHVALLDLSVEKVIEAHTQVNHVLRSQGLRERSNEGQGMQCRPLEPYEINDDDALADVLAVLWNDVAYPVLFYLGCLQPLSNITDMPRITWCTTGFLSFLPLHAAGIYDQPGAKVSDYVVSSYTPNIGALFPSDRGISHPRPLAVGQEATPGQCRLPGTRKGFKLVESHVQRIYEYTQLTNNKATTSAVLGAMENNDWQHMACHAHQCLQDPSQGGFFLYGGILTLEDITKKEFRNKGLAFLSACQTATGDQVIPEESVHLVAGLLTAGYRSVIATMWSVNDDDAPIIADSVYHRLLKDGKLNHRKSAYAYGVRIVN
ncbi:hypothetical protein FRC11_008400 [Ceratobasidium sp. 423]|nr:hypothetical protein FRC11_008400 [Ceratobasidium sp. 423]